MRGYRVQLNHGTTSQKNNIKKYKMYIYKYKKMPSSAGNHNYFLYFAHRLYLPSSVAAMLCP